MRPHPQKWLAADAPHVVDYHKKIHLLCDQISYLNNSCEKSGEKIYHYLHTHTSSDGRHLLLVITKKIHLFSYNLIGHENGEICVVIHLILCNYSYVCLSGTCNIIIQGPNNIAFLFFFREKNGNFCRF